MTSPFESDIKAGRIRDGMSFCQKVWAITARVPAGNVTTYASIARALGGSAYRAVGQALNRNPYAPAVPCHRVVGSDGSLTGFATGLAKKRRMLAREGVRLVSGRVPRGRLVEVASASRAIEAI
jgi:methylated-DNA-[protein]-cysteine S-methyltransferase